jgi:hypothetical protein
MGDFKRRLTQHVNALRKGASIFYNAGHIGPGIRGDLETYTHLELESLPGGSWGYLHLPLTARFVRTLGKPFLGMTGKFHSSWGDFHSFKNRSALEFECFHMLSLGAKCCIGDQLHPNGKIDPVTYDLIGSVYKQVEAKEPWCSDVQAVTDIAVVSPEEFVGGGVRLPPSGVGSVRLLQEGGHQFDMVDTISDWNPYKLLILPDVITINDTLKAKIDAYLAGGGRLIATFESGLDPDKQQFVIDALGVTKTGDGPTKNGQLMRGVAEYRNEFAEYVVPTGEIGKGLPATEHVMYRHGLPVATQGNAQVLAGVTEPYFDRKGTAFSSHRQTPSSGKTSGAAIARNGNCIYFSHPVFSQYHGNAPLWCKTLMLNAIDMLLPQPVVRTDGPSSLIVSVQHQAQNKRRVVHLLHYIPERRGADFDVIEDVIPLFDVKVSLRADDVVSNVKAVPEGIPIDFQSNQGRVDFVVPKVHGHQLIEVS